MFYCYPIVFVFKHPIVRSDEVVAPRVDSTSDVRGIGTLDAGIHDLPDHRHELFHPLGTDV